MDAGLLTAIIQGGAVALLAFVLWQVSLKMDVAMKNMQELLVKMIDIIADTRNQARAASAKSDRNFAAISESKKD